MSTRYDYIVVGSGAGGSAAAWRLAQTGRRVLVLEKGCKLPTNGSTLDVDLVIRRQTFSSKEPWHFPDGRVVMLREYFNIGGKTKWSGAALVRFQPHEFEIDPDHGCRAWPITYDDLASHYAQAERLLGARCFDVEPDLRRILDDLRRYDQGWQLQPLPLGLAPQIFEHLDEVRRFDGGFASARGLKSDAETCLLDRLKGLPQVDIKPAKEVTELEPAPRAAERIAAVSCADGSRYEAETIVLAAGALHSPRLLQRYLRRAGARLSSPSFDHIGRYYKRRLNSIVVTISPRHRVVDMLRKTVILYHPALPHSSVQPIGWLDGEILRARLGGLMPRSVANAISARAYAFWLSTEDGSSADNRVIDADGSAYPILDYDLARLPAARCEHRRLQRAVRAQLLRRGQLAFVKQGSIQSTAYACGTLAAGACAATSVVAADGRVHALENLYVVDSSALPRSGRVNPALTIYAWALRVADLLASGPR